jgi:hypothetical protein
VAGVRAPRVAICLIVHEARQAPVEVVRVLAHLRLELAPHGAVLAGADVLALQVPQARGDVEELGSRIVA